MEAGTGKLLKVGTVAPDFQAVTPDGKTVRLSDYRGKVVILDFWATWCGPCKVEIPTLVDLQKKYANDLVVLGMSVDDPVEKLPPFAEK